MEERGVARAYLLKDITLIFLSVLLAVVLVRTEVIVHALTSTQELEFLGSFIAGVFFTSVFTAVPATVTLGEIAQANSVLWTALFGALGAMFGDAVIFRFVRDRFSEHLKDIIQERQGWWRTRKLFSYRWFRWLTFMAGGLIIASPLPDEFGVSLLGFSKMKQSYFLPLSFAFNFAGIYLIGIIAKALV